MPIKILMPALSPTMTEGNIAKWLKLEGDTIKAGDVIAEIETDKATMEVEAVDEGILKKIVIKQGSQNVPVNSLIAVLVEEGEEKYDLEEFIAKNGQAIAQAESSAPEASAQPSNTVSLPEEKSKIAVSSRVFASPLAKRIAANEGVDLKYVQGTGPGGRIIKDDVLQAAKTPSKGRIFRNPQEYELLVNSNMRRVIAKRLLESKNTVPHFYLNIECKLDALLAAREQINSKFDDKNKKVSVNDFVVLASAKALKDVPEANSSWGDDAIKLYNNVDISVAVAIDGGLVTPIVKNADQKDIVKLSEEIKVLAQRAREGSLVPEEYQGGSFTISNLGMYGIKSFNAIINPPQSCIVAIGQGVRKPVVNGDKIEIATVMEVNLSCDHRVVDGAIGARFLAAFKSYIESPILMFI